MSSKIQTPYPLFSDIDGHPLDAGFIYIGEAGKNPEVYPIPVFWDEDLTIPAEQPIRTRNGYLSYFGRAGKIYVDGEQCSVTVRNKRSSVIYTDLYADLSFTQTNANEKFKDVSINVESIAQLKTLKPLRNGQVIFLKSVHEGLGKGAGFFVYENPSVKIPDGWIVVGSDFTGNWIRFGFEHPDVYMFGAYGDWNASDQTGGDDTAAFQACVDYIYANEPNMRAGGKRFMYVPSGNFRVSSLTLHDPSNTFGFEMYGDGSGSNLWFIPTGNGIEVQTEYSRFRSLRFNGSVKAVYPSTENPAIPYIFRFKLSYKYLDIDTIFEDCDVSWFNCFARVAGRGFTFRNGSAGQGGQGSFLEIACDDDLIVAGPEPAIHSTESAMRHYEIHNNRFDVLSLLVKVTGTHAIKEYINGLIITNNQMSLMGRLVFSSDCRLIKPLLANNFSIGSFKSSNYTGVVDVPRAIDVKDLGNNWNNFINQENTADTRDKGISFVHRFIDVDGLKMIGSSAKDLVFGVIKTTGNTKNITIDDCSFDGFGDFQDNACVLQTTLLPTEVKITKNNFSSKLTKPKRWIDGPTTGASSILINNNSCDASFPAQWLPYTPKLRINGVDSATATYTQALGLYQIDGNYVTVRIGLTLTETASSGNVGVSLPIPAIAEFVNISGFISGTGVVSTLTNFTISNNVIVAVRSNTEQTAQLMANPATGLNLSQKSSNTFTINGEFRYRFK